MTPEQQARCQLDMDAALLDLLPGAVGKVRYASEWIDDNGERYDGYWYVEIRRGHQVMTLDLEYYVDSRETWLEVLQLNIDCCFGSAGDDAV